MRILMRLSKSQRSNLNLMTLPAGAGVKFLRNQRIQKFISNHFNFLKSKSNTSYPLSFGHE